MEDILNDQLIDQDFTDGSESSSSDDEIDFDVKKETTSGGSCEFYVDSVFEGSHAITLQVIVQGVLRNITKAKRLVDNKGRFQIKFIIINKDYKDLYTNEDVFKWEHANNAHLIFYNFEGVPFDNPLTTVFMDLLYDYYRVEVILLSKDFFAVKYLIRGFLLCLCLSVLMILFQPRIGWLKKN
jgi:hypothetical protein